jgi:hypothetical protein
MPKTTKKNPAAVALAKRSARKRYQTMTAAERSEQGRRAVNSRRDRQRAEPPSVPNPDRWYGVFARDGELLMFSRDKLELRQRARAEERACLIEELGYDPRTRLPIVPKYEPDTAACLQALQDLQLLDNDEAGRRGRS